MEQQNSSPENNQKRRHSFLTVLCILSFIGIGIGIIVSIYNITNLSKNIEMMNQYSNMLNTSYEGILDKLIKWGKTIYVIEIVANIICLIGVWMMWNLKKLGYFTYVVGEIAPATASFILLGGYGVLGTLAMVLGLIIPVLFIILYALNLKHMS